MRVALALVCAGCAAVSNSQDDTTAVSRGIDSLNARLVRAYRDHDPSAYSALFTDTAVFEWPAIDDVRGRAAMAEMARANWASLRDMDLELTVASRRIRGDHATEFGAFAQSWAGDSGRNVEYGRYVTALVRDRNGTWLIDRFFGFEDSTRVRRSR